MAVPIRIVLYAPDASTATTTAEAAFARIHALNAILSDYDARSELRQLGNTATGGKTARVSNDLWQVLARARALADQSGGAFDPTVGPVVRLWRRARRNRQLPAPEAIEAARALVGYDLLRLDPDKQTVELLKPGMRLDLGGIAKGYAADEALRVLRNFGLNRALVDAGGDIVLGDPPPDQAGWHIAIAPLEADGPPSRVLSLCRTAIATSGDTWQFVEIDGRRYSHIVDPRTGLGLTDHSSVTIVAPDGTAADGLASAVSVLGPQKGIELIEGMPGTAAFIVRAPDGKLETHASRRWQELPVAVAPSPDEATREVP
ncbi:MAG: FAD:protein FMN transferase [Pirellulales bacterium]|nr:FAD:protein FMN transferase [Pirellulales bacterium]